MKAQYSNQLISSFLMYLDNLLLSKGEAFYNTTGYFYPASSSYYGYYAYSAPYNQFLYDKSITNSIPLSGVYLDNTFITTGQSGLAQIDYKKGTVYFTSEITGNNRISGNFSIFEFNTQLTTHPEYKILFETKKFLRPKFPQSVTGILKDEISFPIIFVRDNGGRSEQYAFGGEDLTINNIRLIVLGDSQFNTDAVTSLMKDQTNSYVPLLFGNEFPFNSYGGIKNGTFNYTGVVNNRVSIGSGAFIDRVQVLPITQGFRNDENLIPLEAFPAIVDLTVTMPRMTRQ